MAQLSMQAMLTTQCPAPVQSALQRVQLDISLPGDESLVTAWFDWCLQQTAPEEKWQSKRQRLSANESRIWTGNSPIQEQQSSRQRSASVESSSPMQACANWSQSRGAGSSLLHRLSLVGA